MEEFHDLAEVLTDAIIFGYIYFAVISAVVTSLIVLVVIYMRKKKTTDKDKHTPKKYLPVRITMIVITGVLILLLAPIIIIWKVS